MARASGCAAFVPTTAWTFRHAPDFVTLSFYKMSYPTASARCSSADPLWRLKRPLVAGGTVNFSASVQGQAHVLSPNEAAFEDGSAELSLYPAVEIGLQHLQSIGIEIIAERVRCLTGGCSRIAGVRHTSGRAMVRIYGPATPARAER